MTTRRAFIKRSLAVGGASVMASQFGALNALAQGNGDYKALVCLFFLGGADGHDSVIPLDDTSYRQWADIRRNLLSRYNNDSRAQRNLEPLAARNAAALGGHSFGLAPELSPIANLFADGKMAVVGNVGPLIEPVTKAQIDLGSARIPSRLESHNDQQSIWQTSNFEGATIGWGGQLLDVSGSSSPFAAISLSGASSFLQGRNTTPYSMSSRGVNLAPGQLNGFQGLGREQLEMVLEQYNDNTTQLSSLFAKDHAAAQQRLLALNMELATLLNSTSAGDSIREVGSSLADQFGMIANMMDLAPALGISRQVFFVGLGGFDSHSNQATSLPALQSTVATALKAFYDHTVSVGLQNSVTTFTAADFGRALRPNKTGTDHGWGNHHYVVGGAVNGGRILGDIPPPEFGHAQDNGEGRLIPTTSIEQYIAPLANWFGVSNGDLSSIFPNFGNFDTNTIRLMT